MEDRKWDRVYFDEWVGKEGLDLIRGWKVDDVYTIPLKPWARSGGHAVQIQLEGTGDLNAAYIAEIAPRRQLEPMRHVYEEIVYVLSGRGSTSVWQEGRRKHTFEWQTGSLFAIPLNCWYQHFNVSGDEPIRYVAVTTAPIIMNLYRNDDFVFNNTATFPERFDSEAGYFSGEIKRVTFGGFGVPFGMIMSNLVPDIHALELGDSNRGVNTRVLGFDMAEGTLGAHTLTFPGGTFSKLHRHGPGAHVIWLKGEGYTLMWPDGGEWVQELWGPGAMLVPPSGWWHQHCIVSSQPAQHLALRLGSRTFRLDRQGTGVLRSTREGGNQMDYEDFPPEVMAKVMGMFTSECARRGTTPHMEAVGG